MKKVLLTSFFGLIGLISSAQSTIINKIELTADTSSREYTYSRAFGGYSGATGNNPFSESRPNQWNLASITIDGNKNSKLYINGELKADIINTVSPSYNKLYIGASYFTSFTRHFKGLMDELSIVSRVKSASEISSYYNNPSEFQVEQNTIEIFRFNESGVSTNLVGENNTQGSLFGNPVFVAGRFGNAISFDGVNDYGNCNLNLPESNITIEFWYYFSEEPTIGKPYTVIQACGLYSGEFFLAKDVITPNILWSTGETSQSITINPDSLEYVWVNDGNNTDTVYFGNIGCNANSMNDTNFVTIIDTNYVNVNNYVDVADSLIIDLTGNVTAIGTIFNSNTQVKLYPNPVTEILTLEVLDASATNTYSFKLFSVTGQSVIVNGFLDNEIKTIDLSGLASGTYYVKFFDYQQNMVNQSPIVIRR